MPPSRKDERTYQQRVGLVTIELNLAQCLLNAAYHDSERLATPVHPVLEPVREAMARTVVAIREAVQQLSEPPGGRRGTDPCSDASRGG